MVQTHQFAFKVVLFGVRDLSPQYVPKVAGPHVDVFKRGVVAGHADLARSVVENHGGSVHLPLEGIESCSGRRLGLPGIGHRH